MKGYAGDKGLEAYPWFDAHNLGAQVDNAALLARAGFRGPRTVFEGTHGFFHAFAHTAAGP